MPSTRRRFLASVAGATVVAGCAGGPVSTATPTDTRTSTESPPTSGSPPVRWSREFPHEAVTAPTLAPGPGAPALYVGSVEGEGRSTPASGGEQVLYVLSLTDGETYWTAPLPNPLQRPPVVEGNRVYAVSGVQSTHGKAFAVHALDRATGERVWTFDTDDRRFVYPLDATEETVFIGRRDDQIAPDGEALYALAAGDGTERWQVESGDASAGQELFDTLIVDQYRRLSAFRVADGAERWHVDTGDHITGPAYDERGLYYAVDGAIHARGFDGSRRWDRNADFTVSRVDRPASAADEHVYVGDYDGRLLAFLTSGSLDWEVSVDREQFRPAVSRFSSRLYVGGLTVLALDPVSGNRRWSFDPDVQGFVDVEPGPESVFAAAKRPGVVFALLPGDGELRWRYAPSEYHGVDTAGNTAYVTAGRRLIALGGGPERD